MNYKEVKEICDLKKVTIKELSERVGYTRQGLQSALDNDTIELRKLKLLCDTLRISPAQFFDAGRFGLILSGGHTQVGNNNQIVIDSKDKEIAMLREQLADKIEIIRMYKEQMNLSIAATPKASYKKK